MRGKCGVTEFPARPSFHLFCAEAETCRTLWGLQDISHTLAITDSGTSTGHSKLHKISMTVGTYWNLQVDRHDRVYVITMQKPPENRINVRFAQEIIKALRDIENELGLASEGCVIIRGSDEKFWCTGLDLDEVESNTYANTDGFFPVRQLTD